MTTPEVDPTNNSAEQAIRFVVIDRHITQGTRSETGRRWSERVWTTIATCAGQGRSVYGYMKECVGEKTGFEGQPSPSLLPSATSASEKRRDECEWFGIVRHAVRVDHGRAGVTQGRKTGKSLKRLVRQPRSKEGRYRANHPREESRRSLQNVLREPGWVVCGNRGCR